MSSDHSREASNGCAKGSTSVKRTVSPPNNAERSSKRAKKEPLCAICLDPLIHDYLTVGNTSPCAHCFHELCFHQHQVAKWLAQGSNEGQDAGAVACPQCQQEVVSYTRLFVSTETVALDLDLSSALDIDDLIHRQLWTGSAKSLRCSLRMLTEALNELHKGPGEAACDMALGLMRKGAVMAMIRCLQRIGSSDELLARRLLDFLMNAFCRHKGLGMKILCNTQFGLETVVNIVEHFPQAYLLQLHGNQLLARAVLFDGSRLMLPSSRKTLLRVIKVACQVMMNHRQEDVHLAASNVLFGASTTASGQQLLSTDHCWVGPMVSSLTTHARVANGVTLGLIRVILNVAEADDALKTALVKAGALPPVAAAWTFHQTGDELVKHLAHRAIERLMK